MSSREICLAILPPDFDLSDKRRVYQVTDRIRKALCREFEAGRVYKVYGTACRRIQYYLFGVAAREKVDSF